MWWALVPSATGAGGRGKKACVEWEGNGCFWAVIWDSKWGRGWSKKWLGRGTGLRVWDKGDRGEGAEDGGIGSGLGIALRLNCCSWCYKCGRQTEIMLNRSLCRQAGSFFLLYTVTMDSRGTQGWSLCPETVNRQWPRQCHCPPSVRDHKGKPKTEAEIEMPLHQLHILYCKLTMAYFIRAYLFSPPLFCQWITAYINPNSNCIISF